LAPCAISSGFLIAATRVSGERSASSFLPSSVRGSPTRVVNSSKKDFQYGGIEASSVLRFEGPTMSTPHAKVSGVNVRPTSVA
jgi:hypothetical protein